MYYVYILQSESFPSNYYTGLTSDLKDRFARHNRGEVGSTNRYTPWKIVFYGAFPNREQASKFEIYLKSGSGRAFVSRHLIDKQID